MSSNYPLNTILSAKIRQFVIIYARFFRVMPKNICCGAGWPCLSICKPLIFYVLLRGVFKSIVVIVQYVW